MERISAIVAVDGGGTKTSAVAVTLDGNVLAHVDGPGSSPERFGLQAAAQTINGIIADVLAQSPEIRLERVGLYLSGLDLPEEVADARSAVAAIPWNMPAPSEPTVVANDLFALLRAGTLESDAVAVVCGTGINCIGVRADGASVRFPALGTLSGDWGGGLQLGEQAMWHAARALDGRGPATSLATRIPGVLDMADVPAIARAVRLGTMSATALAALCPVVFQAAADGDEVARALVDRQADEVVALVVSALQQLELLGSSVPVLLGGGVFAAPAPSLVELVRSGVMRRAPHARVSLVEAQPIVGAALLTLETVTASREAQARAERSLAGIYSLPPSTSGRRADARNP